MIANVLIHSLEMISYIVCGWDEGCFANQLFKAELDFRPIFSSFKLISN